MMPPEVVEMLKTQTFSPAIQTIFDNAKGFVETSRTTMSKFYPTWKTNELAFRNKRILDEEDAKAVKRKEPVKFTVPFTFGQVDTLTSVLRDLFNNKTYFYEVVGTSDEDQMGAEAASALLQRDLLHSGFFAYGQSQLLQNFAVNGLAIVKHSWCEEVRWHPASERMNEQGLMERVPPQPVVEFQGNKLKVLSPMQWFPDVRLPLTRFEEGEFCASEDLHSFWQLEQMEQYGLCAGVENVKGTAPAAQVERTFFWDDYYDVYRAQSKNRVVDTEKQPIVLTEVELTIVPASTEIGSGVFLGPETYPVKYVLWYANDTILLRFEPKNYRHNKYNYDASFYIPDSQGVSVLSLAELLYGVQETSTWFYNTRVANVRKIVSDRLVVDPKFVNIADIQNRNAVIRLREGAPPQSVDQFIKQLPIIDVTAGHVNDAQSLMSLGKEATGLSENLLGQYSSGRRSARESASVNANAMSRVRQTALNLWHGLFVPLGHKLIQNHKQSLTVAQLVRVLGDSGKLAQSGQYFVSVDRTMLDGKHFDFEIFDGTMPSERNDKVVKLQGMLEMILPNFQLFIQRGWDPVAVFEEMLHLMGFNNLNRFKINAQGQPNIAPPNPQEPTGPIHGGAETSLGDILGGLTGGAPGVGGELEGRAPQYSQFGQLGGLPGPTGVDG